MVVTTTAGAAFLSAPRQRRQRREPAAFDVGFGRHAVIGQTIPRRKRQHRHVGAKNAHAVADRHGMKLVRRDEDHESLAPLRRLRREIGVVAAGRAGDGEAAFVAGDVV